MNTMKKTLAYYARIYFSQHGYHGATLREICKMAGCQMPTLYYYYATKENLFDQAVRVAFGELTEQLWSKLRQDALPQEYAVQMVIQKKRLSEDKKRIYRLALKTWLGLEGCVKARKQLVDWEPRH